jgi:HK97 family phage major capsid protein
MAVIDRTDAGALIPEDVASGIIKGATDQSAALTMFRRVNMSRKQQRQPVLSALPTAYFVDGDTGLKQTSAVAWANKYLNAEELAVIVPIPEAVLDDTDFDVWGEVQPLLEEAVGVAIDNAVFFGVNAPASWPTNVSAAAAAAGNTTAEGAAVAAGGFFGDVDGMLSKLELDGFDSSGLVADITAKGKFRSARNTQGDRIDRDRVSADLKTFDGDPITYTMKGLWPGTVRMLAGDWSQFVFAVRKDFTYKILDQAVLTDNEGNIIYNLPQQDMVAMRLVMRVAWQVANPINRQQQVEANRYPASRLTY